MKGYQTQTGFMGYVAHKGKYMLFATESEYEEYITEREEQLWQSKMKYH